MARPDPQQGVRNGGKSAVIAQYGSLLTSTYLAFGGGGASVNRINNFRNIISNPCRA